MVDQIDDKSLNDIYGRAQQKVDVFKQDTLEEWLYHGDPNPHPVKWGFRDGVQRYRTMSSKGTSPGTTKLAEVLRLNDEAEKKLKEISNKEVSIGKIKDSLQDAENTIDLLPRVVKDVEDKFKEFKKGFQDQSSEVIKDRIESAESLSVLASIPSKIRAADLNPDNYNNEIGSKKDTIVRGLIAERMVDLEDKYGEDWRNQTSIKEFGGPIGFTYVSRPEVREILGR